MALTQGSIVSWDDLNNIYTNLSSARTKFGFTAVSNPYTRGSTVTPDPVSNLKTLINEMSSHRHININANDIVVPTVGQLLQAHFLADLSSKVDTINNTCVHDTSDFTFSGNFGFNSSDFGFSGNFGFHSSDFTFSGNFGFHSSDFSFSSNFGFDSGNFSFSGNRGFNSSDFSFSGNRSFNSGNFSFSGNKSFNSGNFSFTGNRSFNSGNFGTFSWRGGSFNSFFTRSSNMSSHNPARWA